MKNEFFDFVTSLINHDPNFAETLMTENIKKELEALGNTPVKPPLTENGKVMLKVLQNEFTEVTFKSSDVAASLGITGRGASGTLRKLVTDGFCDKIGKDPCCYMLTEKGKNFIIEEN